MISAEEKRGDFIPYRRTISCCTNLGASSEAILGTSWRCRHTRSTVTFRGELVTDTVNDCK